MSNARELLMPALRQHRHNYGSEELIPAFDYDETIKIVESLLSQPDPDPEPVATLFNGFDGMWLNLKCNGKNYSVNLSLDPLSRGVAIQLANKFCEGKTGTGEVYTTPPDASKRIAELEAINEALIIQRDAQIRVINDLEANLAKVGVPFTDDEIVAACSSIYVDTTPKHMILAVERNSFDSCQRAIIERLGGE